MSSTLLSTNDPYLLSPSTAQSVKAESSPSPDLLPASVRQYQFYPQHRPHQSVFRFNNLPNMPSISHWGQPSSSRSNPGSISLQHAMPFSDEYDDISEVADGLNGLGQSSSASEERPIRRRSSKACDQCRKSKCKCERSSPNEPCRNCVMLATPCTFLGPSRKRGPPKGYIDAIEARLHQAEALLGIMLASGDPRAETLLRDISQDPLAREIINRVDNSPYGVKGRTGDGPGGSKTRYNDPASSDKMDLGSTHPSNEWQDRVAAMLRASTSRGNSSDFHPVSTQHANLASSGRAERSLSPGPRQRRRMNDMTMEGGFSVSAPSTTASTPVTYSFKPTFTSTISSRVLSPNLMRRTPSYFTRPSSRASEPLAEKVEMSNGSISDEYRSESDEDELAVATGQLSLNEDEQVRYHGKASGLHILGAKERVDDRNEGGIWRFPTVSSSRITMREDEEDLTADLPSAEMQEHFLKVYFEHVHSFLPILHKRAFYQAFHAETTTKDSPGSAPDIDLASITSSYKHRTRRVPALLLFAMFAIAARYSDDPSNVPRPSSSNITWTAGDVYLERAQALLERSYSRSRPTTCQALLLMGYREMGVGAMASAWTYIGMAIRMAQDLGMHRSADGWSREGLGGRIFETDELQERKRIWYACVIMDKYISAYIGRPLMIFERDFDTALPDEQDEPDVRVTQIGTLIPGTTISCFNAAAVLSGIFSMIIQAIYAIRPVSSRHGQAVFLEGVLDKWYYRLPEELQHDPQSLKPQKTLPAVLALHMQYWCVVLLLHRPFIRRGLEKTLNTSEDFDTHSVSEKSYELCASAANHITSIAMTYLEKYTLDHCPAFFCYYIFSASIMHITSISFSPNDPQARMGLRKCINVLTAMQVLWPSATRALELLEGSKVDLDGKDASESPSLSGTFTKRKKRSLEPSIPVITRDEYEYEYEYESTSSFSHSHPHTTEPMRIDSNNNYELVDQNTYSSSAPSSYHQPSPPMEVSPVAPYFPPAAFQRWPNNHFDSLPFASAHPQATSGYGTTMLLNDRHAHTHATPMGQGHQHRPSMSHSVSHSSSASASSTSTSNRHPHQYWHEFSAFPSLENYNNPLSDGTTTHAPSMFMSETYNAYHSS
ncbi:hypothetical protein BT96DRAFT_970469 [Gymnopus androsaceus JB14]|uniref:Zn(2)-C6 fungal-type domain-containing protein n=1 Tax=Gymnopus androsaceus JB14 TaxID=1447944 RepID=A0A6A4IGY7_9AGAR|nr:hypothetical protein BT96DRAFT_970469 [Gymnopus androsaceus JB14]